MKPDAQAERHGGAARVARNSVFVFSGRALDIGGALLSTALIARYLGLSDFGNFVFVTAITVFMEPFADLGIERITTREIASNRSLAGLYFGSAVATRLVLSAVIVIAISFITALSGWNAAVVSAVYVSMSAQLLQSMGMLAVGTFRAFERMEYELSLQFVFNVVYILLVVAVIHYDLGLLAVFAARLAANVLQTTLLMSLVVWKFLKPVFKADAALLGRLFREALPLGIFAVVLTASFKVDVFFLKYYRTAQDVALFEAAHRVIMQLQTVPMSIVIALFPHLSRLARGAREDLSSSFYRLFKFLLILSLPMPILLTFSSGFIVTLLFGKDFMPAAQSLSVLSWTVTFLFLICLQTFVMTSEGRQTLNTLSAFSCLGVNVALDVILIPGYGYMGASLATLAAYGVFFAVSFYFVTRTLGAPPLGQMLPKPLLSAAATGAGCFLLSYGGWAVPVIPGLVVAAAIYFSLIFLLKAFTPDELSLIRGAFLRPRLKRGGL
jgi:O-antigen/teichoic acid export membrane protein